MDIWDDCVKSLISDSSADGSSDDSGETYDAEEVRGTQETRRNEAEIKEIVGVFRTAEGWTVR